MIRSKLELVPGCKCVDRRDFSPADSQRHSGKEPIPVLGVTKEKGPISGIMNTAKAQPESKRNHGAQ
jgi:hypothetical protein